MKRINKKGDKPTLWVVIILVSFSIVAISILVFLGSLKDNSLTYKNQHSKELALIKETLENTNEQTLVISRLGFFNNNGNNPNMEKTLYIDFLEDRVAVKEDPIEKGSVFRFYNNRFVKSEDKRFQLTKDNLYFFLRSKEELRYDSTEHKERVNNEFYSSLDIEDSQILFKNNLVIYCMECDEDDYFINGLTDYLSFNLDKQVVLKKEKKGYNEIYTDEELQSEIKELYKSNSIIILRKSNKQEIIYLDYFSSEIARALRINLWKHGFSYGMDTDVELLDIFKDKSNIYSLDESNSFFLILSFDEETASKSQNFYLGFDFLEKN